MKRNNRLLQRVLHEDNLLLAFWKASKGKRYARQVLAYQSALDENLRRLGREIGLGCVRVRWKFRTDGCPVPAGSRSKRRSYRRGSGLGRPMAPKRLLPCLLLLPGCRPGLVQ